MSAVTVNTPYPTFTDIDGQPLEDGYVWIGVSGLEPQANPQTAYWDAALTQVVTQPVRTRGGYPLNGTAIGRLYTANAYSIKVQNKNSSTIVLDLTGAAGTGVGSISFGTTGLTPAVATDGDVVVAGTLAVANGGTGLAAGTSGGIPYFSSASAMTSSGALAANALMIGGGAGVAPSTTTTGAGILTFLGTPSSANLRAALTDETGSGSAVFATNPTIAGPTFTGNTFGQTLVLGDTTVPSTQRFQIVGDATAGAANSLIRRYSNDASAPNLVLSKSRGVTASATTAVQNGDAVGAVTWQAADGSAFSSCAQMVAVIDGVPATGDLPTAIAFSTRLAGAATANERFRIRSTGGIISFDAADAVGYKGTPINAQSAPYTLGLSDQGYSIVHPITDNNARTFTIPDNGTVAFPVGTTITFINMINTVTIAITTDTMYLAGAGTTGSRTLAAYGMATAVKITSTSWIISGTGLA